MDANQFEMLLDVIAQLPWRQRNKLRDWLSRLPSVDEATDIIEAESPNVSACPHCQATKLYRHGQVGGLQRYRCTSCRKTFNALTKTPLAHLRMKGKWMGFLECMLKTYTVRDAAKAIGAHRNTTFRWRHRFLSWAKNDRPEHLRGIAEADECYILESEKGSKNLTRPARKRGGSATQRGTSKEQVCILVARDRTGQTTDFVAGYGQVTKAQLHRCLPEVLDQDVLLISDTNQAYLYFAHEAGISHESINVAAGRRVRGAFHIQNVNAYHSRFRQWMETFHGVATHYLPNYLGWRRALDTRRLDTPALMMGAALGAFPQLAVT
jgi:transposase-like protein/uncharacterized protein (DUF433 family)